MEFKLFFRIPAYSPSKLLVLKMLFLLFHFQLFFRIQESIKVHIILAMLLKNPIQKVKNYGKSHFFQSRYLFFMVKLNISKACLNLAKNIIWFEPITVSINTIEFKENVKRNILTKLAILGQKQFRSFRKIVFWF